MNGQDPTIKKAARVFAQGRRFAEACPAGKVRSTIEAMCEHGEEAIQALARTDLSDADRHFYEGELILATQTARYYLGADDIVALVSRGGRASAGAAAGGKKATRTKRQEAAAWQTKIRPLVRRYVAAGKSDSNIGVLLSGDAGRSARTVARFAAEVRAKK